jgi:predicted nucleic-acid-binding Zn-ribbon protein
MKDLKIIYSINPVFKKCPECGAPGTLHRSRARTFFEQIIKKVSFYNIYRCKNCGWRGYLSTLIITKNSIINLLIYILLILGSAYIIRFVLTRFLLK